MASVLVTVSIAVMRFHDQSNMERRGLIWLALPNHCLSLKKVRTATQTRHEPGGRAASSTHRGMLLTALLLRTSPSFLIAPRSTSPGVALPTVAESSPLIKKIPTGLPSV